jgi:UDP-N-acetylmuramyl-tripeptide synthetase
MVDSGIGCCILEATSIGIVLNRVYGLPFEVAIFTNLSRDHLDFHGSWEAYLDAKLDLFRHLPRSASAVINLDDEHARHFLDASSAPVVTYAIEQAADYQATNIAMGRGGIEFDILCEKTLYRIASPLIGKFNVYNLSASFAAARRLGIAADQIVSALKTVPCVRGRAETVSSSAPFTIVVDYAHTPDALSKILGSIADLKPNRILTVIGAGGNRDRGKRPEMTQAAEQFSDRIYLTSDNPRSENPDTILQDMAVGISDPTKFIIDADRRIAIENALCDAMPEDVVVIAGKGHETYQEINDKRFPFDDRKIALDWLKSRNLSA